MNSIGCCCQRARAEWSSASAMGCVGVAVGLSPQPIRRLVLLHELIFVRLPAQFVANLVTHHCKQAIYLPAIACLGGKTHLTQPLMDNLLRHWMDFLGDAAPLN